MTVEAVPTCSRVAEPTGLEMDRCVATLCGRCSAWCSSEPDFSAAITGVAALAQDHGLAECAPVVRAHGVVIDNNVTFVKQASVTKDTARGE